jgi:UPF0716 family protein affecting phage T7 exclusion
MNIGIAILGLMLVAGSVLGIIMIGSQNQTAYVDTFGDVQGNVTNDTQSMITNTTSPITAAAGGLALFIGGLIVFIAAIVLIVSVKSSLHGRR